MNDDFIRNALGLTKTREEPVLIADGGEGREPNQEEEEILEEIDENAENASDIVEDALDEDDSEPETPEEHEPFTPEEDSEPEDSAGPEREEAPEVDGEEVIDDNVEARTTDTQRGRERAQELRDRLEDAADLEGERKREILDELAELGVDIHEGQEGLESATQEHVDFTAQRKSHLEDLYGERESELSYSGDEAEGYVESVTSGFVSDLEEAAINHGFFTLQFLETKSQNDLYSQNTGDINQGFLEAGQRSKKFAHHFEQEMEAAKDEAVGDVEDLLDLVQLEEQAEELVERKNTYDRIKEDVGSELETIRNADTEIGQGGYSDRVWGALGSLIETLDEEVESELLSEFNFDLTEYGDPERALHTLRATAADGLKLQQERLYETIDVVNELREGLQDSIRTYESFAEDVENLAEIPHLGETRARDVEFDTVIELADKTVSELRIMSDHHYVRENAETMVESARSYVMEIADSYGLSELTGAMEESWDESTTHEAMVRNQVKGLYESADQVTSYLSQVFSETPEADAYRQEWDGVDAPDWIEIERQEVYGELDMDVPEFSDIQVF